MKKVLLLSLGLCFAAMVQAQVSITVNVSTPETLSTLLTTNQKDSVTNLTLTGTIDAVDFVTLRDSMPLLSKLDLSGVTIAYYYGSQGPLGGNGITNPANTFPQGAFMSQTRSSITSIILPTSITSIGTEAFTYCSHLTSVTIPPSVTSIAESAFNLSTGLTSIPSMSSVTTIQQLTFAVCTNLITANIPLSVTTIDDEAFVNDTSIQTITIPSSVTSIGNEVFAGCKNVQSITVYSITPIDLTSSSFVFGGINTSTCTLYVPYGTKAAYAAANQWSAFVNIVEMSPALTTASTITTSACGSYTLNATTYTTSGTYTQTLPNVAGGDSVITLNLTVNPLPTVTATASPSQINSGASSLLTATGASSYVWSNTVTTASQSVSPTTTTTYTVTGTDANGCIGTASTTVSVLQCAKLNQALTLTVNSFSGAICPGQTATLITNTLTTTTTGGILDFIWYQGTAPFGGTTVSATFNTTSATSYTGTYTVPYSAAGLYSVLVRDHNDPTATACWYTANVTIMANPAPTYTLGSGGYYCSNATAPTVPINLSGTAPFSFTWNDGTQNHAVTSSVSPYNVTVTNTATVTLTALSDANCTASSFSGSATVTMNPLPTYTVTGGGTFCSGTTPSPVVITVNGGTSPYLITYRDGGGISHNLQLYVSSYTVPQNVPGTYSLVSLTDASSTSCGAVIDATKKATIVINPAPVVTPTASPSYCSGAKGTLDASTLFSFSPTGGTAIYTCSPTLTKSGSSFTLPTVTSTTSYIVNVNYAYAGCSSTSSNSFTINPLPMVTVSIPALNTGTGNYCVSNATPLPIITSPATGAISLTGIGVSGTNFIPADAGTGKYTITFNYTDANGCSNKVTTTATVYGLPAVSVTPQKTQVCETDPAFAITLSPAINANSTLTASNAGMLNSLQFIPSGNGATSGTYNLNYNYTDTYGCNNTALTTVTVYAPPTITASVSPSAICIGSGASATIKASGAISYVWNNSIATASQTVTPTVTTPYYVTGTDTHGCTNTATASVTVNPLPTVNVPSNITVCNGTTLAASSFTSNPTGATFAWTNTNTAIGLSASGTGQVPSFMATNSGTTARTSTITVTPTANGCVGMASSYTITVNPQPTVTIIATPDTISTGASAIISATGASTYMWDNSVTDASQTVSPTITTTYLVTGTNANGCNSTASAMVTVNQACIPTVDTITTSACNIYSLNGTDYTTSGTFIQTLKNVAGCDSTIVLNLTINQPTTSDTTAIACNSFTWYGQTVTSSGTATQTLTNSAGCDSIITLHLTINQPTTSDTIAIACNSFTWYGQTVTSSGTATQTLTNSIGCDSVVTLHLTINQPTTGDTTAIACNSFTWYGQTLTSSGTATQTFTSSAGCDSIVTLHLTINQPTTSDTTAIACNSFIWYGQTLTSSGTATQTFTSSAGCDSVVTLHLTINQPTTGDTTAIACNSFTWYGQTLTSSGTATQTLTNSIGCDSVVTLHLTINQPTTGDTTAIACNSFTWYGQTLTSSGTATQTLTNSAGCDSIITLHLTINQPTTGDTTAIACNSFTWYGQTLTSSGTATQTLTNSIGCDSIITLHLTINQPTTGDTTAIACNSFTWYGQTLTSSGTATQTLTNSAGCDSVITLNLIINTLTTKTITASACGSYSLNGTSYTTSGTYYQTLTNVAGCDSVITLNLTMVTGFNITLDKAMCQGDTYNGHTTSGTYTDTFTTIYGCDSVVTINLTVNIPTTGTITASACESYILNDSTYTASGIYTQTLTNKAGCDSVITLHLTINKPTTSDTTAIACNSFTWYGQTFTSSGTATQTFTNSAGCDSIVTLHLTILPTTSDTTAIACNSFTWYGQTFTSSGTATQTLTNSAGCDSVVTLHLTINQPTADTITTTACGTYSLNGTAYTASGTYTQTLTNVAGCDSVITLNLTINPLPTVTATATPAQISSGSSSLLTATGANSYVWSNAIAAASQSVSPTATTTYSVTGTDVNGCVGTASTTVSVLQCAKLNQALTLNFNPSSSALCPGQTAMLSANKLTTTTTGGILDFIWYQGTPTSGTTVSATINTTSATSYTSTYTVPYSAPGLYTVLVRDHNLPTIQSCWETANAIIWANPAPAYTIGSGGYYSSTTATVPVNLTGTTPFSLTWNDGTTSHVVNNISSSPYDISVTSTSTITLTALSDAYCNASTFSGSAIVIMNTLPTYTVSGGGTFCPGTIPNPVVITITGGTAPYSMTYVDGGGTTNITNSITSPYTIPQTIPGTYSVTGLTDASQNAAVIDNTKIASITINPLPTITATTSASPVCKGTATTVSAGGASFYIWDNGIGATASATVTPTTTTTYTVTGIDGNGCVATANTTVTVNQRPTVTVAVPALSTVTGNYCVSNTTGLAITYSPVPIAPATGTLSGTGVSGGRFYPAIFDPTGGTYTIVYNYTDANGCSNSASTSVPVFPLPVVTWASNPTIVGGSGSPVAINVHVNVSSGVGTFGTLTGLTQTSQTSAIFNPVTAGSGVKTLTYTFVDANGCSSSPVNSSIDVYTTPVPATMTMSSLQYPVPFPALPFDVTSQILQNVTWYDSTQTITEGTGNTYTPVIPHLGTSPDSLKAGIYRYLFTQTINGIESQPASAKYYVSQTACIATTKTITASACGTYSLNGTAYTASGTYTQTLKNVAGCDSVITLNLTINPVPTVTAMANPTAICRGNAATLQATGGISFAWDNAATTALQVVSPTATAIYTVTGTDGNGCTATASTTLQVDSIPNISISAKPAQILVGDTTVLTLTGASSCMWSNGVTTLTDTVHPMVTTTYTVTVTGIAGACNNDTVVGLGNKQPLVLSITVPVDSCKPTSNTITASACQSYSLNGTVYSASGTYTQTLTNVAGCDSVITLNVTINPLPTITASATPQTICTGFSSMLSASGGSSYVWSNLITAPTQAVSPTAPTTSTTTTYVVTGTDANGCMNSAITQVTVYPLPTVIASASPSQICQGQTATLSASGASTYSWSSNGQPVGLLVSISGLYIVTGTDNNACVNTASTVVTVNPAPSYSIGSGAYYCSNFTAPAVPITLSGTAPFSFTWNDGSASHTVTTSKSPYNVVVNGTATITLTALSDANCVASSFSGSAQVTKIQQPNFSWDTTTDTTYCQGNNISSLAIIQGSAAQSTDKGYAIVWSNGATGTSISALAAGNYSVTITNQDEGANKTCSQILMPRNIVMNPLPTYTVSGGGTFCQGTILQPVTINVVGGTAPYSLTYTDGSGTNHSVSTTGTYVVPQTIAGIYSVAYLTDASPNGCVATIDNTKKASITINPLPIVSVSVPALDASTGNYCVNNVTGVPITTNPANGTITGNGVEGTMFMPSAVGAGTSTIYFTYTDANGCTNIATTSAIVNAQPNITAVTGQNPVCYGTSTTISASGGNTYIWNNNVKTASQIISPLLASTYTVTGTDINGCVNTASVIQDVNAVPMVSASATPDIIDTGYSATLKATGAVSYVWDNAVTTASQKVSPTTTTTYTVTGTDANGCTGTANTTVTVSEGICMTTFDTITIKACGSYLLNGRNYYTSGTYSQILMNVGGCDSLLTLILTVNNPTANTLSAVVCGNYTLNGITYTQSGTYTQTLKNSVGCDSIITLELTINKPTTNVITTTACGSYKLNETTYTASGTYKQTVTNVAGCDSIIELTLTVIKPTASTITTSTCDSYTLNGTTYNASGTYTQTVKNAAGCDSTITLNLTISYSTTSSITATTCGSYTLNGKTFSQSGTYTDTIKNSVGCDSIITLHLTITPEPTRTITATANGSYMLYGKEYTASGTYTQTITNMVGCDSIITLNLTIIDVSALQSEIAFANDTIKNASIGTNIGQHPDSAQTALKSAVSVAQNMLTNATATQANIDQETVTLQNAITAFDTTTIKAPDKSKLQAKVDSANTMLHNASVGTGKGQYSRTAYNAFNSAIYSAQAILNNANATATEITQSEANLSKAETAFENAKITTEVSIVDAQSVSVGPIPTFDFVNIRATKPIQSIVVVAMDGKNVLVTSVKGTEALIDLTTVPSGSYIIKIISPDNTIITKTIVKY